MTKAVARKEETGSAVEAVPQAEVVDAFLAMIERAARDPATDLVKMQGLFALKQQNDERRARIAFDEAFAAMQPELPEIDKRGKIIIKEKGGEKVIQSTPYALWDDTNRLIKPILAKFGFGLSFRIAQTPERLTTTAVLSHRGGHREETQFAAPIDATGSKNNVQGWGSSFSYGKRYAGTAILNITTRGEDDDGKAAGGGFITEEQETKLRELIEEKEAEIPKFCGYFKIEKLGDLKASDFDRAVAALNKKARANG